MEGLLSKKIFQGGVIALLLCTIASCTTHESNQVLGQAQSEWDFDHKLQFKKTKFDENHYQLEVIPNSKVSFERLSAFLLRRGYLICGTYGYKLEMITGVESFDYPRASPNFIMPNLTAKLECPIAQ